MNYQTFPKLDDATEAALTESIERLGVLVPILVTEEGDVIDGHHRQRIAEKLLVDCPALVIDCDDESIPEISRTVNEDRRQILPADLRRTAAADLRASGHSQRAIAKALGVSQMQIRRDISGETYVSPADKTQSDDQPTGVPSGTPERIKGLDGKNYPSKPNVGGGVSHPARYSSNLVPVFERHLELFYRVLDPFAGTGQRLEPLLARHDLVGVELEPEWASVSDWVEQGNALALRFDDASFDAICTSPTYGNRLADHHNAKDPESRRSYTHDLGRTLGKDNSGVLHWGDEYRAFHERAWLEAIRVLRPGGRFVLNIKDHIRGGKYQHVSGWHFATLLDLGLRFVTIEALAAESLKVGANAENRIPCEFVAVFVR